MSVHDISFSLFEKIGHLEKVYGIDVLIALAEYYDIVAGKTERDKKVERLAEDLHKAVSQYNATLDQEAQTP